METETVGLRHRDETMAQTLEAQRRRAWAYYRAVLRGRSGRDYEELEPIVWAELRQELAELDAAVSRLTPGAP
jgi:hypothetical protein